MESTIIKYVSAGNPFSPRSKTLKRRKVLCFFLSLSLLFLLLPRGTQALLHSLIHLIWPSCGEHVPRRRRLGLLANWDDLTRGICTGGTSLALSAALEANQTFTCSLSTGKHLKITRGRHQVYENVAWNVPVLPFFIMFSFCLFCFNQEDDTIYFVKLSAPLIITVLLFVCCTAWLHSDTSRLGN